MNVAIALLRIAGLNTAFMKGVQIYTPAWMNAMTFIQSGKDIEDYSWLGDVSQMEEFKGEYIPGGLNEYKYTLINKEFGSALLIRRNDLKDDQYGQLVVRATALGGKARVFPGTLLRQLRVNGKTNLAYDGQAFFSETHEEGNSGVQSNLVTGTGDSDAQISADFESAYEKLFSFKTDKGDPFDRSAPQVWAVCGPKMSIKLRKNLLKADKNGGESNEYAGLVSGVEVDQGITTKDWWIEDRGGMIKAYILQENEALQTENTMPGSDRWVEKRNALYTAHWRGNGGYGLWQNAVMIDNNS